MILFIGQYCAFFHKSFVSLIFPYICTDKQKNRICKFIYREKESIITYY